MIEIEITWDVVRDIINRINKCEILGNISDGWNAVDEVMLKSVDKVKTHWVLGSETLMKFLQLPEFINALDLEPHQEEVLKGNFGSAFGMQVLQEMYFHPEKQILGRDCFALVFSDGSIERYTYDKH